jgi:hypothetical protein
MIRMTAEMIAMENVLLFILVAVALALLLHKVHF